MFHNHLGLGGGDDDTVWGRIHHHHRRRGGGACVHASLGDFLSNILSSMLLTLLLEQIPRIFILFYV